jgi:hypothetical protein
VSLHRPLRAAVSATIAATAALLTLAVATAQADSAAPAPCQMSALSQPFLAWGDSANYVLVPGADGSFGGWSLTGGAGQVSGGYGGGSALGLPSGAVATSPGTCINMERPPMRFFMRADTPGVVVHVSSIRSTPDGAVAIRLGSVEPGTDWSPSAPLRIRGVRIPKSSGTAEVTLQFTASGGTAQIDDVYVDPWRSG